MPGVLRLNCLIFGEGLDDVFPVDVLSTENVYTLKEIMQHERDPEFQHVHATSLVLWKVDLPVDINVKDNVKEHSFPDNEALSPVEKLLNIFSEQPATTHLHIIIKPTAIHPIHFSEPRLLELNCVICGDYYKTIFSVKISSTENIDTLKEVIQDKRKHEFQHVDASTLLLWKVDLPADENLQETLDELSLPKNESLWPVKKISGVFLELPAKEHVHIVIKCPPPPPPSINYTLSAISKSEDSLRDLRLAYLAQFSKKSPSQLGWPSQLYDLQTSSSNKSERFGCNRPPSAAPTIPVTLLHPVLNEFVDDCKTHKPTREDNELAFKLSIAMSRFFETEKDRQTEFIRILKNHNIHVTPAEIVGTSYCTDGDMRSHGYPYFIVEIKLDMGSKGVEPVFQAATYYLTHLRNQPKLIPHFTYPCLAAYLMGSTFGFVGLVFTDRVIIQVFGPAICFDYHCTDEVLPTIAARYLGALRKAIDKLRRLYRTEALALGRPHPGTTPDPRFPCYTRYTCLIESVKRNIRYGFQPFDDKLIFICESGGIDVCIKFVTEYSKEAHEHCASRSIAPKLRGFETLPGGWFMVVMDCITEEFVPFDKVESNLPSELYDMVLRETNLLHQAGYVHGDLRDANIVVRRDREPGFMLLDFDWAGTIGEVRYPTNVNTGPDLWRPADAYDGELIKVEHDIAMINHMFRQYRGLG